MDGGEAMALDPEDVKDDLRAELFVLQTHNTECIEGEGGARAARGRQSGFKL